MTTLAREVLGDARRSIEDFEAAGFTQYWRTRWVAVVGLLRAVGNVLAKVDSARSPGMGKAVKDAWADLNRTKPEPRIFWEFIQDERNNILKAYEFGAHLNITISAGVAGFNLRTGQQWSTPGGPRSYGYFMKSGPFASMNPVVLAKQAVDFWSTYLDSIDSRSHITRAWSLNSSSNR